MELKKPNSLCDILHPPSSNVVSLDNTFSKIGPFLVLYEPHRKSLVLTGLNLTTTEQLVWLDSEIDHIYNSIQYPIII